MAVLRLDRLYELEHEAHFAIYRGIWCEKLFDFERRYQLEEATENVEHVLHECVVVLRNQTVRLSLLDEVGHGRGVDQENVVDRGQVDARVPSQHPITRQEELKHQETGLCGRDARRFAYFSVEMCAL